MEEPDMECKVCGEPINPKRAELGYDTCLKHGESKKIYPIAPGYNKGAYQLVTHGEIKTGEG